MNLDLINRIKKAFKSKIPKDTSRESLKRNFVNKNEPASSFDQDAKEQSLKDSQGVSDFSGSAYNGPGNVDREKTNSNMSQRNF